MRGLIIFSIVMFAFTALAQQNQTPMEQAITSKLSEEINQNIQYRTKLIQQQQEIDDLKKRLSEKK